MSSRTRILSVAAAAAVLGLAACGGAASEPSPSGSVTSAPAAPSSPAYAVTPGPAATGPHNDADVAFAAMMVPHHEQAVAMSDLLLAKTGVDADVVQLATTIKDGQVPEIDQMAGWLQGWGAPVPTGAGGMSGMDHASDGMMSSADMDALAAAQGKDAQTLYLRGMIRHHEGAIAMANTEVDQGTSTDARTLALTIITTQQDEVDQMKQLLAG